MWHLYLRNVIAQGMKIAYMHYHLKTGGVTTVIKQQLSALAGRAAQLVLSGQPPETPLSADVVHIPELSYSSQYSGTFRSLDVARTIIRAIHDRFGGPCDVLHVHNPTLAKNRFFLEILELLQQRGVKLLLQIHDFAEDGRPLAYFSGPYPADCHYAVINRRDLHILRNAGLKFEGVHLLENTVSVPNLSSKTGAAEPIVLYPIRAIRRKNIGEAILLSRFLKPGRILAITLPPHSPPDIKSYEGWKKFVQDHHLNVVFERGLDRDFGALVSASEMLITTSITEGFGFSFLEPWLYGKMLWGRKLPDICQGFEHHGIKLSHLYDSLRIPTDWIDLAKFGQNWRNSVLKALGLLDLSIDGNRLDDAFDQLISEGTIDFGLLDELSQKMAIGRIMADQQNADRLLDINPFLEAPGEVGDAAALIDGNRQTILNRYNPDDYARNLMRVYLKVSANPVEQQIDKSSLVSAFLDLNNFSLLKWRDYSDI